MSTATKKTTKAQATKKPAQVTEKKEFNLERALTLWIQKGKKGGKYLSGVAEHDNFKVTGFFNNEKQNPKEPDIRIYVRDAENNLSEEAYCSLWCNVSEASGKKYLSGKLGENRVVGFFNSKAKIGENIPYINVYFSEDEQKADKVEPEYQEIDEDDDLPF